DARRSDACLHTAPNSRYRTTLIARPANLAAGALIAMVLALCAFGFSKSVPESLWGHLKAGMDMLALGHPIWKDPYSYISDIPWIDHEWLFEVILAACYKAGGLIGVSLVKLAALELLM